MEVRILGPFEVTRAGRPVEFGGVKQRAVLAALVLDAGRVVSMDRLIDKVWSEKPPLAARRTLQTYVSQLRSLLEPERPAGADPTLLVTEGSGYVLRIRHDQVDAHCFEQLLREGRAALSEGHLDAARRHLRDALQRWRGPVALAEFGDYPFAVGETARLEQRRLDAVEAWIEAELALGMHQELVAELEGLVKAHPLREDAAWPPHARAVPLRAAGRCAQGLPGPAGAARRTRGR